MSTQLALLPSIEAAVKPAIGQAKKKELFSFQRQMIDEVYDHIRNNEKNILLVAPGGCGKAQPIDSKVLTPAGFKSMGSLQVGDLITGQDGYPCQITGIFPQGIKPVYRVTMTDGSSTLCCDDHLWNVQSYEDKRKKGRGFWRTVPLSKIRETQFIQKKVGPRCPNGKEVRWQIPLVQPVQFFPVKEPLPFDSYALGLLLGDGCFANVYAASFSCPDVQLQESLSAALPVGCFLTHHQSGTNDFDLHIVAGDRSKNHKNPVLQLLRDLRLSGKLSDTKFIPDEYLYASVDDRLAILQGLFDTDGCPGGSGSIEYVTTSKQLSEDVTFLVQSLGGTAVTALKKPVFSYRGEKREGKLAYRMQVKLPVGVDPFRLERKLMKFNETQQNRFIARRGIEIIEYVGEMECQCISVDAPNHLYVTDDFIVTHNTLISSVILKDATIEAKKPLRCFFLVNMNSLINQTIAELSGLGVKCAVLQGSKSRSQKAQQAIANTSVVVASIQTIQSRMKKTPLRELLGDVGLFVFDEAHTSTQNACDEALREEFNLGTIFLGLTGSPWIMGSDRWLGQKFDVVVKAPSNPELVKLGRIVPARSFTVDGVLDATHLDVDKKTGDFAEWQMSEQVSSKASLKMIVENWVKLAEQRSTVAYCPRVADAQNVAAAFNEAGISAEWQSGDTPLGENGSLEHQQGILTRAAQNYRLDVGITKVVASVGTQSTGWNLNSLGCVMLIRATRSKSLFCQISWRGSRTCESVYWNGFQPKQNYLLLDFGGNIARFHPLHPNTVGVNEDDFDISEPKRKKRAVEGFTKDCPSCNATVSQFTRLCPDCGYEFNPPDEDEQEELELDFELKEWFDPIAVKQVQFLRTRKRQCYQQDLSPQVAVDEFRDKFGFVAESDWHYAAIFGKYDQKTEKQCQKEFKEYLLRHAPANRSANIFCRVHFGLEFGFENKGKRIAPAFAKSIVSKAGQQKMIF